MVYQEYLISAFEIKQHGGGGMVDYLLANCKNGFQNKWIASNANLINTLKLLFKLFSANLFPFLLSQINCMSRFSLLFN